MASYRPFRLVRYLSSTILLCSASLGAQEYRPAFSFNFRLDSGGVTPLENVRTAQADSAGVVKVAEDLLRAISTRDTALARKVMMPGAQLASVPDPASATTAGRMQGDQQFITSLSSGTQKYLERMWTPTVFLQGSLAIVRAPYDFHIDGTFSHCGVDVFTMVKSRGEWVITHVVYTAQRTGCAASPLGPPK